MKRMFSLLAGLMAQLATGGQAAALMAGAAQYPVVRGQRGMTDIIGPATNWPNGRGPSRRDEHRAAVAARKPWAPGPKFAKTRKRYHRLPKLRDEHGAYTLVGRLPADPANADALLGTPIHAGRRKWLAGISAQRGY